jgi:hypothetical protein
MLRTIAGIIIGYLVFALSAVALFRFTGHQPHTPANLSFEITATLYGMFFAFMAGYWGLAIAGRRDLWAAIFIAVAMAAGATVSLFQLGFSWSPVAALVFMVPAELAGGYVRMKKEQMR